MDEVKKFLELRFQAKDKAFMAIWQQAYKDNYVNNCDSLTVFCSDSDKDIMDKYIRKVKRGVKYVFFVVNPRDDVTLEDLMVKVKKCCSKCWIGNWMYNFEQRGYNMEEYGHGVHVNMLFEVIVYKKPSDMKREVYNTFKHLVGSNLHVCMRCGMDCTNFVNYINGVKKDESKQDLMDMDII